MKILILSDIHANLPALEAVLAAESMNADEVIAASVDIDADIILAGHTHLLFLREAECKIFCNPGSAGLARDHGGEACYAVWENGRLMLKRTSYDVSATIARLQESPLDEEIV